MNVSCEALYAEGQSFWPEVALPFADFAACVARLGRTLTSVQAGDVYLCCACAHGDAAALRLFEGRFFAPIDRTLAGMRLSADDLDEIRQQVRAKLFLRQGDELPKIAGYAGRGDLATLVKVVAFRTARNFVRTQRRRQEVGEEQLMLAVDEHDGPELAALKERLRSGFRSAIASAVSSLSVRQRTILRLHFVDGLTIDDVGALYHVHRATAARWLAAAKEALMQTSIARMQQQLGLSEEALASAQRLMRSQIDLSISRIFRDP